MNPARVFLQTGGMHYQPPKQPPEEPGSLPRGEARALATLQREAQDRGATLHTGGRGGIPPSKVLGVLRRDEYECKVRRKGCTGNKDLTMHHKGGILASAWLRKKGHSGDMNNIVTTCMNCHDTMHESARADGIDAAQQR